jgi:sugar phosphate isomerase/epimerase
VPHAYHDWVDRRRLKDTLSVYKVAITMHAPFTDLNPANPFEPVRGAVSRTLREFVDFAGELNAVRVTFHPGSVHSGALVPESLKDATELFRGMVKEAGTSLSINLENQARSHSPYHYPLGTDGESIDLLLSRVEGIQYTLDTGHAHVSGVSPMKLFERFKGKLTEVHLHDNRGEADEHLCPGEGTADLKGTMEKITPTDAFVCLEMNPFKYSAEEVVSAAKRLRDGKLFETRDRETSTARSNV